VLALLFSPSAFAHKQVSSERAILQLRPDAILLLYEATFSPDEASHWRLLYDANRNSRLSPDEYRLMARGIADALRERVKLTFDGRALPVEVLDAKVSASDAAQPFSGKLQALVMLQATDLAPGLRKIGIDIAPLTSTKAPSTVRIEEEGCEVKEITGAPVVKMDGDRRAVQLRAGWPAILLVDFPLKDPPTKK
jgi:hypothetical protein